MAFRTYFARTIFVVLLLLGPLDHVFPDSLLFHIGYISIIPLIIWLILGWIWDYILPSEDLDIFLNRILSGLISIAFFTYAFFKATSKTHVENTKWVSSRDGMEAVGDDIIAAGVDWGAVVLVSTIGMFFFWHGVLKKRD